MASLHDRSSYDTEVIRKQAEVSELYRSGEIKFAKLVTGPLGFSGVR